ncbi:alpha/beta hydrolase family protein [Poritiphilus flavus]|uniref:Platelet-activating factor acetylhydrolase n=1 Tax=Poritiphilus flavus TaxID=2697053 RepID=A0A6L9EGB2_9FLAO|nr:hypothetical protein [Poritiphilus flavus]NAS13703.1 hypothetical protein [Poritiphilus flavus]
MQFLELVLLFSTLALLVVICFLGERRNIQLRLIQASLGIFILHMIFEVVRWQMVFIYVVLVVLGLLFFKRSTAYLFFRILGFLLALVLLVTSAFYSSTMPILKLDEPIGKYAVGHTSVTILNKEREEHHTKDPNDKRALLLEIWYPAVPGPMTKASTLWSGLYSGERDVISFFTNYLQEISTHSFPNLRPAQGSRPLILFNHGLQMFASQNTLLMEHLASHGYIVASIGHPYESIRVDLGRGRVILPEFVTSFENFQKGMQWIAEASRPIEEARKKMASLDDRATRAKVLLTSLEKADAINETVVEWTKDNQFVLNWLLSSPSKFDGRIPVIDASKIGVMGMSIGGATAGEMCIVDQRITAGINIDGLQYGTTQKDSLKVPFMMLSSEDGVGMNDFQFLQSKAYYYECHLTGTRHADLTDLAVIWPILKYYGQSGDLEGERVMEIMNTAILNFWDRYLKGKQDIELSKTHFPELRVETNLSK